jgi:hypothetical protein
MPVEGTVYPTQYGTNIYAELKIKNAIRVQFLNFHFFHIRILNQLRSS